MTILLGLPSSTTFLVLSKAHAVQFYTPLRETSTEREPAAERKHRHGVSALEYENNESQQQWKYRLPESVYRISRVCPCHAGCLGGGQFRDSKIGSAR